MESESEPVPVPAPSPTLPEPRYASREETATEALAKLETRERDMFRLILAGHTIPDAFLEVYPEARGLRTANLSAATQLKKISNKLESAYREEGLDEKGLAARARRCMDGAEKEGAWSCVAKFIEIASKGLGYAGEGPVQITNNVTINAVLKRADEAAESILDAEFSIE